MVKCISAGNFIALSYNFTETLLQRGLELILLFLNDLEKSDIWSIVGLFEEIYSVSDSIVFSILPRITMPGKLSKNSYITDPSDTWSARSSF